MRFMMLMIPKGYETAAPGTMPDAKAVAAMMKYNEELKDAGVLITLDGLHPPSMGARVSFAGGKPLVTDGPFTEAKEVLGGYWMIEVASREEAIAWAKRCPASDNEIIEIRQVQEMADFPADVQQAAAGFPNCRASGAAEPDSDLVTFRQAHVKAFHMSWRKEHRRPERGYHHGNLKEALLQAALGLIAEKGAAGFTFADAARMAGVSPAAPYRHFRDRDELLSSIAQRGFEQFEAVLTAAWDDGRPDTVTAFERVGNAYLAFARKEPAFYSAMFESGLPIDRQSDAAGSERARLRHHPRRRRTACRAGAAGYAATAGDDDGAAYLVDVAWRGFAVRARRCGAAQVADVGGGSAGSRRPDLSARARLSDRAQARCAPTGRTGSPTSGPASAARPASIRALGHAQNKLSGRLRPPA